MVFIGLVAVHLITVVATMAIYRWAYVRAQQKEARLIRESAWYEAFFFLVIGFIVFMFSLEAEFFEDPTSSRSQILLDYVLGPEIVFVVISVLMAIGARMLVSKARSA